MAGGETTVWAHVVVGAWERQGLVGLRQISLFTATHFAWLIHELQTGRSVGAGGGTYSFDGRTLKETYEFSSAPQLITREIILAVEFQCENTFMQTGAAPIAGISQDESYRRIG